MLILIGTIIGFVMGLTGAGGALIAIPLFMQFLGMSLKEASVYSLIAVVIASLSHFYYQRKEAKIFLAFILIISSACGSFLSLPYKALLPEFWVAIILSLIALYSLYGVWIPRKVEDTGSSKNNILKTVLIGFTLGVLTTFTGLGGGVLMLPILLTSYQLPQKAAVATSLMVVGLSSLFSFLIQIMKEDGLKLEGSFIGLLSGILITSYFLKIFKVSDNLRKAVFTIVVALSLIKIF